MPRLADPRLRTGIRQLQQSLKQTLAYVFKAYYAINLIATTDLLWQNCAQSHTNIPNKAIDGDRLVARQWCRNRSPHPLWRIHVPATLRATEWDATPSTLHRRSAGVLKSTRHPTGPRA